MESNVPIDLAALRAAIHRDTDLCENVRLLLAIQQLYAEELAAQEARLTAAMHQPRRPPRAAGMVAMMCLFLPYLATVLTT